MKRFKVHLMGGQYKPFDAHTMVVEDNWIVFKVDGHETWRVNRQFVIFIEHPTLED